MGQQVTIGGDRLGNNNRNKVWLREYERSTHDLSFKWRSSMAAGMLVPFMSQVALPGDTFDINLYTDVMTMPTIGPLFGNFKLQLDVFQIPIRLYQAKLHMNMLNIGLNMSTVALPQIVMRAYGGVNLAEPIDNQQVNPSSIFANLGIRGVGYDQSPHLIIEREFNAVPLLGYWEIYKNYYANKQEEIGYVVHKNVAADGPDLTGASFNNVSQSNMIQVPGDSQAIFAATITPDAYIEISADDLLPTFDPTLLMLKYQTNPDGTEHAEIVIPLTEMFQTINILPDTSAGTITCSDPYLKWINDFINIVEIYDVPDYQSALNGPPALYDFPLDNIDDMRKAILQWNLDSPFLVTKNSPEPYGLALKERAVTGPSDMAFSKRFAGEGLAIKTYNSDLFNNWIQTDFIDGVDGISAVTAVSTAGGSFTIDELNLSKKVYDMLNRIAISGGSYDDWLDAVYTHERSRSAESPIYLGGLIQSIEFEEVISNAATEEQPLGTIGGRGRLNRAARRGGEIIAKIDEPSYIMGIVSITPNIDYSQGNQWDVNLKTMNDFHKPALDEIGFQDLITDQMGWWDTQIDPEEGPIFKSAGKQPAWINYMTNVNTVRGNFAIQTNQMFMTLNRRYGLQMEEGMPKISDVTTYIDPTKYNNIFADVQLDAQNFWVQIAVDMTARRKMSAKVMPNL